MKGCSGDVLDLGGDELIIDCFGDFFSIRARFDQARSDLQTQRDLIVLWFKVLPKCSPFPIFSHNLKKVGGKVVADGAMVKLENGAGVF